MLNENTIRAIEKFDLESYVRATFDKVITSGNDELRIDCISPHGCAGSDRKAHLWINIEKRRWHCFRCGYGSSQQKGTHFLPRFIADSEGISIQRAFERITNHFVPTPEDDLELLLERMYGINQDDEDEEIVKEKSISLPEQFFQLSKSKSISSKNYQKYAIKRGFISEYQHKYNMRFCISRIENLPDKHQNSFSSRIIWPIYDQNGVCRSAVARDIGTSSYKPRWINWPDTDLSHYFWPLGCILPGGGFKANMSGLESVVLTEGIVDAHVVNCFSNRVAFACFGKKLSEPQIQLLHENKIKEIILAWDLEAKPKMIQAVKRLSGRFKLKVFPFLDSGWHEDGWDLGDVFNPKCPYAKKDQVQRELDSAIDVESTDFVRWIME